MKNTMNSLTDQVLENVVGGVSPDQAVAAALGAAGVPAGSAMLKSCEMDYEFGTQVYEVEFYFNGMEYNYKINAATGAVLSGYAEYDD